MRLLDIYVGLHICNSIKSVVSSKDLRTGVIFCPNTGRFMERVLSGSILALCAVFSRCDVAMWLFVLWSWSRVEGAIVSNGPGK